MSKDWRAFQSLISIRIGSILFPRRLINFALLLVIAAISGCNSSSNAQLSASEKWTGEWQLKDPGGSGQSMKIILTPKGKAYLIPPQATYRDKVAYDIPLEKVSNKTSLPPDTKVIPLGDVGKNPPNKARNREAKTIVGSMNRAQQAYYLENDKFSTKFSELGLGLKQETEHYVYKIVPQSSKSIMNIGQAKVKGLNSYVGLVYITEVNNGEKITLAKLCETTQALSRTPKMPRIPNNSSEEIKCPSGFKALR